MNGTTQAAEPTWPQLLGSNNWEGLLDPLDLSLRKLILRRGDLCWKLETTHTLRERMKRKRDNKLIEDFV
jgi:hypothetical protein